MDHDAVDVLASVELIRRGKRGDAVALDELCRRYLPPLLRWASGRLPVGARGVLETQDLVQDVIARTMQNLDGFTYEREGALLAYMRTSIVNRVREEARRIGRRGDAAELDEADVPTPTPSPLEEAIGVDALDRYERAMDRISETDRELIILRVEMGMSYDQLAEAVGKPSVTATRMAVSRALARLAAEMADPSGGVA